MKRKIFIGSSTEGIRIAEQIEKRITEKCGDWLVPVKWTDQNVFTFNQSTLQCLLKSACKYEYGIFIATKDDVVIKRLIPKKTMRDNVLFELGLFLGSLGYSRTFLLADKKIGLPSDFAGTTISIFDRSTLDKEIDKIIKAIERTKKLFNFRVIPSTALAFGYFKNYVIPITTRIKQNKQGTKLIVKIPRVISSLSTIIEKEIQATGSKEIFNNRPTAYLSSTDVVWDIPTNLITLHEIIDKLLPNEEIGYRDDYNEIIGHELRNFTGTLESLVKNEELTKDIVFIEDLY